MDKKTARKVIVLLQKAFDNINDSLILVKRECPDAEFKAYRKACGRLLGEMFIEVSFPILDQHPDLRKELKLEESN